MSITRAGINPCAIEIRKDEGDTVAIGNRIFIVAIILSIIGFLFVVDTSLVFKGAFDKQLMWMKIVKQVGFIFIGWTGAFYLSKLGGRSLRAFGGALMFASLVMLLLVFSPLGVERNHCRRWIAIGPLTIQPLEFFKVALVMQLAGFLSAYGSLGKLRLADITKPGIAIALGLLLLALQPNLSAVVFVSLVCLIVAWIGGLPTKHLLYLGGFFGVVFLVLMLIHSDRIERIIGVWNLHGNISGAGYQVGMALLAMSRGGIFGVGVGQSVGKFALPYNDSDFIFTIIIEELGLMGGIILVLVFAYLVYLILRLARSQKGNYPMLVCFGIGVMIAAQAAINIAVNLGFLPTTGMPLPFISAGGSNLVATLFAIGILLNIAGGGISTSVGSDNRRGELEKI